MCRELDAERKDKRKIYSTNGIISEWYVLQIKKKLNNEMAN